MPVTPITPAQIDEVGKGASSETTGLSPIGHAPTGHEPAAVDPSRGAFPCPHCDHALNDANALFQHVKAKHGRKAAKPLRPVIERESSIGEIVAEAQMNKALGLAVDPWVEEMFGDYL